MATCGGGNNFGVNAKVREADHALKLKRVEDIRRGGSLGIEDHYVSNALKAMCRLEVEATGSLGADLRLGYYAVNATMRRRRACVGQGVLAERR